MSCMTLRRDGRKRRRPGVDASPWSLYRQQWDVSRDAGVMGGGSSNHQAGRIGGSLGIWGSVLSMYY